MHNDEMHNEKSVALEWVVFGERGHRMMAAKHWVAVVAWSDCSLREIEVVGLFSSYDSALVAVHAHLVGDAQVVMGPVGPGQRSGTVADSNVTWDWVIAPVERVRD